MDQWVLRGAVGDLLEGDLPEPALGGPEGTRGDQYYWTCTSQPGVLQSGGSSAGIKRLPAGDARGNFPIPK